MDNSNIIDYSFFFGVDLYSSPNDNWKYKGLHEEKDDTRAYNEYTIRIIKPKEPELRDLVLFTSCISRVYDNGNTTFIFKGCKSIRENLVMVLHILEKFYGDNLRFDTNYIQQIYYKELRDFYSTYKWITIQKKCINGVVANIAVQPHSKTFEMHVCVPANNIIDTKEILYPSKKTEKILIFDVETTGLIPGQHSILQLSYQVINYTKWRIIKSVNHYFDFPKDSRRIDWSAINKNKLDIDFIKSQKISTYAEALRQFYIDLKDCQLVIAHNLEFDKVFVECAVSEHELGIQQDWPFQVDTMVDTVDFCRFYPKIRNEYKWPKLSELAQKLDIKYKEEELHNSKTDVEITKRCFRKLCKIGFYQFR